MELLAQTRSVRVVWSASVVGSKDVFVHSQTLLLTAPAMKFTAAAIQARRRSSALCVCVYVRVWVSWVSCVSMS